MSKATCIMVQGTMSGAGKSLLCAALCRIFAQDGWRVAPFKSQNMALNSFVTRDGLEMGRAQVVQAQAAGVEPDVRMNPILLKPSSDIGSQVIVNGEVRGQMPAAEYFRRKKQLIPDILAAYNSLAEDFDIIVIEGAGSPAEINLKADDIVNMGLAKLVDAPVLLVGDIDRGGVFAQLFGTVELLEPDERARIKGLIINKFRGDVGILRPGLAMLEEKTHLPVFGVVPYLKADIEDEDSLSDRLQVKNAVKPLDAAIVRLPHISNFTDFMPLEQHPLLGVRYVQTTRELGAPDCVILPGTKNTVDDLLWLRQCGLEAAISKLAQSGDAQRLMELVAALAPMKSYGVEKDIDRFENDRHIHFSPKQRQAIVAALEQGVLVITGGPGTGKTTIIKCIISLLSEFGEVVLCAPTGRAAKRMTETTGYEAKTIHRLLEYGGEEGQFGRNQDTPIEGDCIIADETSMVDMMLMRSFLRAVAPGTRLILVGDADQLPSVGAGNVLGDILQSGVIPSIHLTDIFRQSETSRIVTNAHRINEGKMPLLNEKNTDFFFERQMSLQQAADTIVALTTQRLPRFLKFGDDWRSRSVREIQVLAPMKKGECGVQALNIRLQEALNPPASGKPSITYGETIFRVGDYDMEWRRRVNLGWEDGKGVFNGDVGFVTAVDTENHALTVRFDDEKDAEYTGQQLEDLDLAYCLSVHKSQGSEFPVVILPVVYGPMMLLTRNLFYTALTRARKLVVLVGREEIIRQMVENDHIMKRYTTLSDRLRQVATMLPKVDVFGAPIED